MRVFVIAHRSPYPPFKGSQVRSWNIIKALAEHGHEVHAFAFEDEGADSATAEREICRFAKSATIVPRSKLQAAAHAGLALISGAPISQGYMSASIFRRKLRSALEQMPPDALVVHSSNVGHYVPPAWRARTFFDMTDVDSQKFVDYGREQSGPMAMIYRIEGRRLRAYELASLYEFGKVCLVTEVEADLLRAQADPVQASRLMTIANGVDLDYFNAQAPITDRDAQRARLPAAERKNLSGSGSLLVFTGAMDYSPNVEAASWFANAVLPKVRAVHREAQFIIVGSRPTAEVHGLARMSGVIVTGFVADVRPYLAAAAVVVAPLRYARGIQNKALEAMASARALVTTPAVAKGLSAHLTDGVLIAQEDAVFADHINRLLGDPLLAAKLGAQARTFVETHYAWRPLMAQLIAEVERLGRAAPANSVLQLQG
jgi:polysaccharide biosynthesis protein PslH